jgi:hypothetical protein
MLVDAIASLSQISNVEIDPQPSLATVRYREA